MKNYTENFRMVAYAAILSFFAVLCVCPAAPSQTPPAPPARPASVEKKTDQPDVVLLLLDALRADRIDGQRNGQPLMPWLSGFARTGTRFARAYSPCSWTRPSMASLFTSLNVETHQVYFATDPDAPDTSKSDVLPDKLPTLATWLKGAGYGTRAVQTNGNLAKEFGFANGYDDYVYEHDAPATRVTDLALDSLNRAAAGPLLLYAHYIDPHAPYVAPAKYVEMLGGLPPTLDVKERAVIDDFMPYFMDYSNFVLHKSARKFPELSDNGKEAVRLQYDAEARYLDDEIKRLVETIQRDRPNTIFIFLADHGESFWEHGFIGHGLTMYEEEIHIPLIVCGPGFDSRVMEKPVGTVGLLPTLAKRLSLDAMPAWQGRDWLSAETAPVYSYTLSPWKRCGREIEAVIEESPKLIRNCLTNEREFYCVSDDPGEHSNQLAIQTDAAQKLTVLLDEHRKANVAARTQTGSDKITLDDERLEELRSQGYIQVDSEDKKSR